MEKLKKYILKEIFEDRLKPEEGKELLQYLSQVNKADSKDIAIIGMACNFPLSETPEKYWDNIKNKRQCMMDFPQQRRDYFENTGFAEYLGYKNRKKNNIKETRAGYLVDVDKFDANFFNIPPREAKYMDPAQRLFLQSAWSAIEDAGYGGDEIYGSNTGVFLGRDCTSGTMYKFIVENDPLLMTGTWEGIMASRINYIFNLRGPSMVIDTACSSGLVVTHMACKALLSDDCEMALAGAVTLGATSQSKNIEPDGTNALQAVQSDDSRVKTFDKDSTGTIFGEGIAAIVLKRLDKAIKDNDNIYAVIKGSAINSDGASNGITAPNPAAQEDVILKAWKEANINPETIGYIEAHGTGTILGDPIEVKGLTNAFRRFTDKKQFCGIGSVKTNMGHLVASSGIAGIIKVVMAMKNKAIPPSINFRAPNPHISFINSPFYVAADSMQEWKRNGSPRRAGVSAFGFSGTNCHVVLEEAPEIQEDIIQSDDKYYLFTLSAKTQSTLGELLERYTHFALNNNRENNIQSICYTSNKGRGHYEYRLAIVVNSSEDLAKKIMHIKSRGIENIDNENIYYGFHRIVSPKKRDKKQHEITQSQKRTLTDDILDIMSELKEDAINNKDTLIEISKKYVLGADVNWNSIHKKSVRKTSLPTYAFEKTICWGNDKPRRAKEKNYELKIDHPLIDYCISTSIDHDVFESNFSVKKDWVLSDHKLIGKNIIPGTAIVELGRKVAEVYYTNNSIELKDIIFMIPIVVEEDETKKVKIFVNKKKDHLQITIASKNEENSIDLHANWDIHAEIKAYQLEYREKEDFDIEKIRNRDGLEELDDLLDVFKKKNGLFVFGPRWMNLVEVLKGENDLLVELKLKDEFEKDLEEFILHPSLLDTAVNFGTQKFGDGRMYLPFSYKSIKIYGKIPKHFYSFVEKSSISSNKEVLSFNIKLVNDDKKVFCEIVDYTIKKVKTIDNMNKHVKYHKINWVEKTAVDKSIKELEENIIVFKDEKEIAKEIIDRFRHQGVNIIEVDFASEYEKLDGNNYLVGPREEDYIKLFKEINNESLKLSKIVHLGSILNNPEVNSVEKLGEKLNRGVYSLYNLTKALVENKIGYNIDIIVISTYADEVNHEEIRIEPENEALFGIAKVIPYEHGNISMKMIDIDDKMPIDTITNEILLKNSALRTAFRDNIRYIEELSELDANEYIEEMAKKIDKNNIQIKSDGVYVITGGTGGIGLEMASYIASKGESNICLINRSGFPEREEWKNIIENDKEGKFYNKIRRILDIEELGGKVSIYRGDVNEYSSLEAIFMDLKERYTKINGIFHCAGKAGDGFIFRKDKKTFDSVLLPKIKGTWIIDKLTEDYPIDFIFLFSSIATILGGPGQSDYTAANSYLNSYSKQRNKKDKLTISINWPAWSETGMAVDYGVSDKYVLFKSVDNSEAMDIVEDVLSKGITNVVPSEINYDFLAKSINGLPIQFSQNIIFKTKKVINSHEDSGEVEQSIVIKGKGEDEYTDFEKTIGLIYGKVLDLQEIDIYENFNSMGGDSILATVLLKQLNIVYDDVIDISAIFSYPTIADMAEYIGNILQENGDKDNEDVLKINDEEDLDKIINALETGEEDIDDIIRAL